MTMFSTEIRQLLSSGGRNDGYSHNCVDEEAALIGSDLVVNGSIILMAEEESTRDDQHREKSNSRSDQDHREGDKDWLQLSIGGSTQDPPATDQITSSKDRSSIIELALMPSNNSTNSNNISPNYHSPIGRPSQEFRAPMMNYAALFSQQLYPQDHAAHSWGFRPHQVLTSIATPSSSSSSFTANPSSHSMARPSCNYIKQPFQVYFGSSLDNMIHRAPAGIMDFRVVQPPRRPHSGLWFMLQALQNQEKEPYLPQIPKMYLRIKDGKMTIRLVMKYLVNKLKLENESEVEIICRGQKVLPFLTLQHVRDNVWSSYNNSSRDFITLPPDSSTIDHIMVLHYGRISPPHTSN